MKARLYIGLVSAALMTEAYSPDAAALVVNVDEFAVVRDGTTVFDDSFNRNTALNGGTGTNLPSGTTFNDGTPANYFVQGSILETTANNGQAQLNTANGRLMAQAPPLPPFRRIVNANLQTGTNAAAPQALTPANTFSEIALFDVVVPSVVLGQYAIDLSNSTATPGREITWRVRQTDTGLMLQLLWSDEAGNQTLISQAALTPAELANPQIELELSHDNASSDVVTALYAFGSGNTLASFNGTLIPFASTDSSTDVFTPTLNFVLPHFFASEPVSVPEPSSLAILVLAAAFFGLATQFRNLVRFQHPLLASGHSDTDTTDKGPARIAALVLVAAWFAGPGDGRAQSPDAQFSGGLTCPKLPPEGHVTSNPIACTVSCAKGGNVASALALAPRTTAGLTITIRGTCVEAVDQVPGNVALQGASSGDGLQAPAASSNPVLGISGAGVTIDNLTISGGATALWVHSGASAVGTNLEIEGSSSRNVFANGVLTLNSSTIENSKADGIDALSGGIVFLNGGTVRNNARGVSVGSGSYLDALGGAVISDNTGGHGALVNGSLAVIAATIESNSPDGVHLFNGGTVVIAGPSVVTSNARDGVQVMGGSAEVDGVISNNGRNGIFVLNSGTAIVDDGAVVASNVANGVLVEDGTVNLGSGGSGPGSGTVQSNGANGIYLKTNSVGFFNNNGNQIVSNKGWGILCDGSPASPLIAIGPAAGSIGTVSGNGSGQISCNIAP